jgi:TolA-binding protein
VAVNEIMNSRRRGAMPDECPGDLLAIEQRGELSDAERSALQAHCAECSSCRHARQVFADLADGGGVEPQDGARIERMSNAARRWAHQRNRRASRSLKGRRRPRTFVLAAWMLLVGGTASATAWLWRHPPARDAHSTTMLGAPPGGAQIEGRARRRAGNFETAGSPVSVAPLIAAPPAGTNVEPAIFGGPGPAFRSATDRETPRPSRRRARMTGDRSPVTPALLLRQASDARRAGDDQRAIGLYRKLQDDFPGSAEAVLASVPIGGLLLQTSAPRAALAAFDAYLSSSRGGALLPEALYGRGRTLAVLGDRREERRTWERLLADFPDSAYGPLARRRLAELR